MIAALSNRRHYLRIAFGMLLILFTGCKVVSPIFVFIKAACKEISAVTETSDDKSEKMADDDTRSEKKLEYASIFNCHANHVLWHTLITHFTVYASYYQSSYYLQIISPPPDFSLHINA